MLSIWMEGLPLDFEMCEANGDKKRLGSKVCFVEAIILKSNRAFTSGDVET